MFSGGIERDRGVKWVNATMTVKFVCITVYGAEAATRGVL